MNWFHVQRAGGRVLLCIHDDIGHSGLSLVGADTLAMELGNDTVDEMHVDSGGGCARTALDACRLLAGRVRVARIRRAFSAAATLALVADVRRVEPGPGSRFMTHSPRSAVIGTRLALLAAADVLEDVADETARWIASRTGQPLPVVEGWKRGETYFTGPEAVAAGLAHEVAPEPPAPEVSLVMASGAMEPTSVDELPELLDVLRASGTWRIRDRGELLREFWHWAHSGAVRVG